MSAGAFTVRCGHLAALLLRDAGAPEYVTDYQARAAEIRAAAERNAETAEGVTA